MAGLKYKTILGHNTTAYGIPWVTQIFRALGTMTTRYRVTTGHQGIDVMEKELARKVGKEISAAFFEPGRIPVPVEPRRASGPSFTASLPFLLAQRPGLVWPHDFRLLVWGERGYGFDVWPDNYNRDHLHLEVRCDIGLGGCGV
jgi:hypothetical protein